MLERFAESVSKLTLLTQARLIFLGIGLAFLLILYCKLWSTPDDREQEQGINFSERYRAYVAEQFTDRVRHADYTSNFHSVLTLFLLTQSRSTNVPLYAVFRIQQAIIGYLGLSDAEITVTSIFLQYTSFFALGGSNSIASVDLSNAYNGVGSYNVVVVGILTFLSNWAGPIWWVSATYSLIYSNRNRAAATATAARGHLPLLTLFVSASVLAVMVACTVLRAHLFIWTVFSPKFLYTAVWTLGQHLVVNLLWGECFLVWLYK